MKLLTGGLAALVAMLSVPAQADGLIDNANGYTLDAKGDLVRFTGMLIGKDGRVTRLLDKSDKPPKTLDFRLDAKGRTLVPGLIEPGTDLMESALAQFVREPQMAGRPIQPRERDVAFIEAQKRQLARGVTSVVDLSTSIVDWEIYRRAGDAGRLRIRIMAFADSLEAMTTVAGNQPTDWLYDGRLRMAGLTVYDAPPLDDAKVRNLMSRGAMDGFQIAARVQAAEAAEHAKAAIDEVALTYKGDRRWRLELDDHRACAGYENLLQRSRDAAHGAFAEGRLGTLTSGAAADFLLFDGDVVNAPETARLAETWIGGVRAWVAPPAR